MPTNKVLKRWPQLYDHTKNGQVKVWNIRVESLFGDVAYFMSHGLEDGTQTESSQEITQGKNIGKKNETTISQQAILEAGARWRKKVDAGMVEDKSKIGRITSYFPMLAKTAYSPWSPDVVIGKKKITILPPRVLLQRKLNGVRCPAVKKHNKVKLYSRKGKEYTQICDVLTTHLTTLMTNDDIWDGEIYVHGWSLERIAQAVKRDKSKVWRKKVLFHCKKQEWEKAQWWVKTRNDTQHLEYHRYDRPKSNISNAGYRVGAMSNLPTSDLVFQEKTIMCAGTWSNIKYWHDEWVKEGYEGIIIRDPEMPYLWNGRGKRLLKYKEFQDEEFEIIGAKPGTGTDKGAVCWQVRGLHPDGSGYVYFDCRPRGTLGDRRSMYRRRRAYYGKMLTVRFQERSDKGVPLFPTGITIRDYE